MCIKIVNWIADHSFTDSRKLDIGVIGVCPLNFQSAKVISHRLACVQAVNAAATTLVT